MLARLRLGLMRVLGINDEAERQHELAELGTGAERPGPLRAMCETHDLGQLRRFYQSALADLGAKVAAMPADDAKLAYHRSLLVLTKKVELDLGNQIDGLTRLYADLEQMHDFVHEIYPAA
ncbi:MAG TPA: DUF3209 family protein [Polyangia bacterium]